MKEQLSEVSSLLPLCWGGISCFCNTSNSRLAGPTGQLSCLHVPPCVGVLRLQIHPTESGFVTLVPGINSGCQVVLIFTTQAGVSSTLPTGPFCLPRDHLLNTCNMVLQLADCIGDFGGAGGVTLGEITQVVECIATKDCHSMLLWRWHWSLLWLCLLAQFWTPTVWFTQINSVGSSGI